MRLRRGMRARVTPVQAALLALGMAALGYGTAFAACSIDGPSTARVGALPRNPAPASSPAPTSSLAASTGKPWVPEKPVARRERWEQVLLLPPRLVSLPLALIGHTLERGLAYGEDSGKIPLSAFSSADPMRQRQRYGVTVKTPGLPDHSGLGAAAE